MVTIVILAGGNGTRMNSSIPKVCHLLNGKPMICHIIETCLQLNYKRIVVIASPSNVDSIRKSINNETIDIVIQEKALGTGHALLCAKEYFDDDILTLLGDVPLIRIETLTQMINMKMNDNRWSGFVLTMDVKRENKYGRIIFQEDRVNRIIEYNDANEDERKIITCNTGIMLLKKDHILSLLTSITNNNSKEEYYLTDIFKIAEEKGLYFTSINGDETECSGVNTIEELKSLENMHL
jgi:bifunctional UDP-N-acetylglucosamine pyrophosphorylase/glucosamine-1-phosphate N-acetyltransferase